MPSQVPKMQFNLDNLYCTLRSFTAIGKLYSHMILDCSESGKEVTELLKIFNSFISDEISDFKTGIYFENPSYLEHSYQEGCCTGEKYK